MKCSYQVWDSDECRMVSCGKESTESYGNLCEEHEQFVQDCGGYRGMAERGRTLAQEVRAAKAAWAGYGSNPTPGKYALGLDGKPYHKTRARKAASNTLAVELAAARAEIDRLRLQLRRAPDRAAYDARSLRIGA